MKNNDWFDLISILAVKYKTSEQKIMDNLIFAIEKAYLKENVDANIRVDINQNKKLIQLFEIKNVVEDYPAIDDDLEITIEEAIKIKKTSKIGDALEQEIDISNFERRIAAHVKQVFDQKMSEVSNLLIYEEWENKVGTMIKAEVEENKDKYVEVNLGANIKGVVLKSDQIKNEKLEMGRKHFFYIKTIKESTKGWPIILSRSHAGLVENLLKEFIDEIKQGLIEIKAIARIAGFKTKIAVESHQEGIDAIGACVGVGGERIKSISKEINDEFIDFVRWDDDIKQLIVNACVPHHIIGIEINDDDDNPESDHKLISLVLDAATIPKLIGRDGANIKLISKIINCTIEGIFSLEDAIENEIQYQDVSNLNRRSRGNSFIKNYNRFEISDDDYLEAVGEKTVERPRVVKKPKRQVAQFETYFNEEYEVKTYDSIIDEASFDDIINNISVPKKEKFEAKVVNVHENIDDMLFDDSNPDKDFGPKYKKARIHKKNIKEEESIFKDETDDFQDITEDSLNFDDDIDFSDNLEIDEEE